MATPEQSYTSTGDKILHHPDAVRDLQDSKNHPIVLHIMPTERCNLRCSFCSVGQRGKGKRQLYPDLTLNTMLNTAALLKKHGLKAVILSGGGEPTLYSGINDLIRELREMELRIGLITNGLVLSKRLAQSVVPLLDWVRVSANTLDYTDEPIILPLLGPSTTLGLSYIVTQDGKPDTIERIKDMVKRSTHPVSYVRLLPDCNLPTAELEQYHEILHAYAEELGPPFFHQWKSHKTPAECHLPRVHPVLYTDEYIYPCDSCVLNSPPEDKRFHDEYRLCHWTRIEEWLALPVKGSVIDTKLCPHCVFARQNECLKDIIDGKPIGPALEGLDHKDFV